ncbi:hypothetical protein GA516_13885 [Lactobacillus pentosus]|uniref:Uncharacterized protein n=1 Tax=Lactiplantibacillus pentosus TaxID=1589 RepID=A0AB37RCZ5_LACPE|nr:hypothetical protein [Lactiplantibacillus pentosus]MCT3294333.1 hypothetical protein [Lactiplantibacillus pentosus]MPQ20368.1 hypothetical protein [Lactiplantibacillus pentosus]RMW42055.1 hypothetical protein D6U19_15545 [Lactiplantibacillus pentosus]RMW45326.1 hypothetical protein D6U20_07755 [Lactiplantibacillus pentosus]
MTHSGQDRQLRTAGNSVNLQWWWRPTDFRGRPTIAGTQPNIDLSSRRKSLRNFKFESYSKSEESHFRLRIIWLLSIVRRSGQLEKRSNGR